MIDLRWFKDRKILVTGHTGFKGSWLCKILADAGAYVTGYALDPPTEPNLFNIAGIQKQIHFVHGDVRDLEYLLKVFSEVQPEIVIHLAAQAIVRVSYSTPVSTYETNVMGTVNICECVRLNPCVRSFLNVTTDKVYENREWEWGYRENELLDGYDPYSNSKSCSELVTHSYIRSYFEDLGIAVSTARAGNVIGGGDFADNRIIPDCIKAMRAGRQIIVRNPSSIRPYQHVLESLAAYLMIIKGQYEDRKMAGYYNVGPDDADCTTTGELVDIFCEKWGKGAQWKLISDDMVHEAGLLKLDCSKLKKIFGWKPTWNVRKAIEKTVELEKIYIEEPEKVSKCMKDQINEFFRD